MSGYTELRDLGVTFRPFDGTTLKPPPAGTFSPFTAGWSVTVEILARELRHLQATNIVIELDLREGQLRADGLPRADARLESNAVRISFDSKHGPLRYETNEFVGRWGEPGWQSNMRAIALGLEALRKVDRYGVSKRGEQYRGWKQLPASTDAADSIQTRTQAEELLESYGGLKAALRATHPDLGGQPDEFRKVIRAKELVGL